MSTFNSEEEAARAYDERAVVLSRPVNFPKEGQEQAFKRGSSMYRGVTKQGKKWRAQIKHDGKMKTMGTFDSEEAAAQKYDEAAAPLGRALNFPLSCFGSVVEGPAVRSFWFHDPPPKDEREAGFWQPTGLRRTRRAKRRAPLLSFYVPPRAIK